MDLSDFKVSDAHQYVSMMAMIANSVAIHIDHEATCREHECSTYVKQTIAQAFEGVEWTVPRSLALIEAKKAADTIFKALEATQQEVPR